MSCGCNGSSSSGIVSYIPNLPPCPDGYTLSGRNCIKTSQINAVKSNNSNYEVFWSRPRYNWGTRGTVVLDSSFNNDEFWITDFWINEPAPGDCCSPWDCLNCFPLCSQNNCYHQSVALNGPVNRSAVWNDSIPVGKWVGFSKCIEVEEETTYYVGMASGYIRRIQVDGTIFAEYDMGTLENYTSSLNYYFEANYIKDLEYHSFAAAYQVYTITPITLSPGIHRLDFLTQAPPQFVFGNIPLNSGTTVYTGALAVDVFNCSLSILRNATTLSDITPYRVFSSATQVGSTFNYTEYTCPTGFTKSDTTCDETPVCTYTETVPANLPAEYFEEGCPERDLCEDVIPTDCVTYDGDIIACSEEANTLHPVYSDTSPYQQTDHVLIDGEVGDDGRNLTTFLDNLNKELCYIFSKDFIKNVLNYTATDTDLSLQFKDIVCNNDCDCEPPVYRPHFKNNLPSAVDLEIGLRVVSSPYVVPAPVDITLYTYNSITLPANSDVVAVTTPINTQAVWICITVKNTNSFGIVFNLSVQDNDGNTLTGSPAEQPPVDAGTIHDTCIGYIPYILPFSDDYNIVLEILSTY